MTGRMPVQDGSGDVQQSTDAQAVDARQNPDHIVDEADHGGLKRSMGLFALLMFSVGSIIGTGIFVILGEAIPKAGPAVIISFVLAAVVCAFSALSYAELAGTIPGFRILLLLRLRHSGRNHRVGLRMVPDAGVRRLRLRSRGRLGQYLNEFLSAFGIQLPAAIANPPGEAGGVFNLPAVFVVVACMFLLLRGPASRPPTTSW